MLQIIIVGDESPAKTTLIQNLCTNLFIHDYRMTIGVNLHKKDVSVDGRRVRLVIIVFGEVHRFMFLVSRFIKVALGGLFLFDIADSSSLACIDDWLSVIRKDIEREVLFPILVVGLLPDKRNERQVSTEEGVKIANSRNLNGYIECSPKTGENVEKVFEALTRLILADTGYNPPMKAEDIKIFVDVSEKTSDKVVICQEIADKLGIKNGASIEVHNPDNGKKAIAEIEISNMILDFAGQVSKNIVDSLDFMGVELILRSMN